MRRLFFITAAFTMLLPAGLAAEPRDGWYPDFDEAVAVAKKSSKDLLIDFTGSDWCVWCIRLKQEVFDQKEFQSEAPKSFVLVSLDFPNSAEAKAKVPNPARNQELAAKYGIEGYPTILLMTAGGAVYGQTGYREGGAVPYLAHLDQLRKNGKQALDVVNGFAGSTGKARTAVMRQAIDLLLWLESGSATGKLLAPIARNAALSKKGAPEYELKAEALKALFHSGNSDAELQAAAREVDPKNTTGLLERAVLARCGQVKRVEDLDGALRDIEDLVARGPIKDTDTASQLYANAAWWYSKYVKKPDKAKTYAKKLQAIAKDDARFASVLDEVLGKNRQEDAHRDRVDVNLGVESMPILYGTTLVKTDDWKYYSFFPLRIGVPLVMGPLAGLPFAWGVILCAELDWNRFNATDSYCAAQKFPLLDVRITLTFPVASAYVSLRKTVFNDTPTRTAMFDGLYFGIDVALGSPVILDLSYVPAEAPEPPDRKPAPVEGNFQHFQIAETACALYLEPVPVDSPVAEKAVALFGFYRLAASARSGGTLAVIIRYPGGTGTVWRIATDDFAAYLGGRISDRDLGQAVRTGKLDAAGIYALIPRP